MILSPLSRQCKKPTFQMWNVTLYLEGIFHGEKRTPSIKSWLNMESLLKRKKRKWMT
jgi:hypothetical protein